MTLRASRPSRRTPASDRSDGGVRVGPAGWSYPDWKGIVYPERAPRGFDPLAYLAHYFDTIEINSTFYGPPSRESARKWVGRVEGQRRFKFTAKLWRRFTHERSEAFTRADVAAVRKGIDPLHQAGKLGALLLQFPWSFRRTDENRQWLEDVTRAFRAYPLVLEVRHASWHVPEFYDELVEHGIGFVNIDQPLFHHSIRPSARVTAPVGYVRVHGRNYRDWFRKEAGVEARYDYLYSAAELRPWAERTREVAEEAAETYTITNNHYEAKAVTNALMLESMLAGHPVPAPPLVMAAYPAELRRFARPERAAPRFSASSPPSSSHQVTCRAAPRR